MVLSMAPRARGEIHIPCTTEEQCKAIHCLWGAAHCIKGQCICPFLETKTISCSNNTDCVKKCDFGSNHPFCLNGQCHCTASQPRTYNCILNSDCDKICHPKTENHICVKGHCVCN
ncbi:hypothetical protein V6N13_099835 [Hibiscus sabdariffa]